MAIDHKGINKSLKIICIKKINFICELFTEMWNSKIRIPFFFWNSQEGKWVFITLILLTAVLFNKMSQILCKVFSFIITGFIEWPNT